MSAIPVLSRRTFLGYSFSGRRAACSARAWCPASARAGRHAGAGPLWQAGVYLAIDADGTRRRSSPIARRWAPASAPPADGRRRRARRRLGARAASSRPSATPSTARRTPTAPAPSRTSTTRCASPAPAPGRCWSRRRPPTWNVPLSEVAARNHASSTRRAGGRSGTAARHGGGHAAGPRPEGAALQGSGRLPHRREDGAHHRPRRSGPRQGHLRHRRAHAGHGLRGDRAAAGAREQGDPRRRRGGAGRSPASRRSSGSPEATPPYAFKALGGAAVIADST